MNFQTRATRAKTFNWCFWARRHQQAAPILMKFHSRHINLLSRHSEAHYFFPERSSCRFICVWFICFKNKLHVFSFCVWKSFLRRTIINNLRQQSSETEFHWHSFFAVFLSLFSVSCCGWWKSWTTSRKMKWNRFGTGRLLNAIERREITNWSYKFVSKQTALIKSG